MKAKYTNIIGCVAMMALAASCSNSEYDYDHLFPEEYHKVVYINEDQDESFVIYDADEPHTDTITVIKAGSHPQLEGNADIVPCTTEELDSLSKDYAILPSNCYTLDASVHFASNIRYAKVPIAYDLDAVKEFMNSYTGSQKVALALHLTSSDCTVNEEKQWYFRRISVEQPQLSFVTSSESGSVTLPFTSTETEITTKLSITNKWDFNVTLSTASAVEDVESYNSSKGTSYKLLPADNYSFTSESLMFTSGTNSVTTKLTYNADNLDINSVYLLPVRMTESSMVGIELSKNPLYIIIDPKVTLTTDMLSSPCTEQSEGSLYYLIDNDASTFWHSVWKTTYYNDDYGHYFEVHLDSPLKQQLRFDYYTRNQNSVLPLNITIFVSADGSSWTKLVELDKDKDNLAEANSSWTSPVYDLPFAISYLRFSIFKSNNGYTGRTGSSGSVAINGFDLWGK